jgi:(2Fe-2S) ferredoxin
MRIYLCNGPHCTANGAAKVRSALDQALWDAGLLGAVELHASGCQDHCDHGPNMIVQPDTVRYYGLSAERVARIVAEHLRGGEPITAYLATAAMRRGAQKG